MSREIWSRIWRIILTASKDLALVELGRFMIKYFGVREFLQIVKSRKKLIRGPRVVMFAMPIVGVDKGTLLDIEIISGSAPKTIRWPHRHRGDLTRSFIVGIEEGAFSHHKKGGRHPQKLIVTSNRHGRNLAVLVPNNNQVGTLLLNIQDLGFGDANPKR